MKPSPPLDSLIHTLRGQRVILDADLAALYGVPTKALNQAIKRNLERFPQDFMFQLTPGEWGNLKSQFVTSRPEVAGDEQDAQSRSQIATGSHGGRRKRPFAFTEHGAIMAASVLNSPEAVAMSLYIVRAFIRLREQIAANADILRRLAEIDQTLLKHDRSLQVIWRELQPLLNPPSATPKPGIGFHVRERSARYPARKLSSRPS
jgi:hypothetical protein